MLDDNCLLKDETAENIASPGKAILEQPEEVKIIADLFALFFK